MQMFLLCLWLATVKPSLALFWQNRRPVVSGTERLEPEELAGKRPIFVDAFLNQIGGSSTPAWGARIVFSYNPMFGCLTKELREEVEKDPDRSNALKNITCHDVSWRSWKEAHWSCHWRQPGLSLAGHTTMVEEGEVLHDSGEVSESLSDGDPWGLNESVNAQPLRVQSAGMHHALVVGCALPPALAHLQEWQLDVTASHGHLEIYSRKRITVRTATFVRPGVELALCTMVSGPDALLWPWVKFHAQTGFDQILVYVEAADMMPVSEQLSDLVAAGLVTLVPFFFGEVSLQKLFYMQASMGQHCLYQAKGRATWLGHSDIDEFFELRGSLRQAGLKAYLNRLPRETPGVIVSSQFWHGVPGSTAGKLPFPCNLMCKVRGYWAPGERSKWVARPEMVEIFDPHNLQPSGAAVSVYAGGRVGTAAWEGQVKVAAVGAGAGATSAGLDAGAGDGMRTMGKAWCSTLSWHAPTLACPNPDSELRVNHFRHCHENGHCEMPPEVAVDCLEDDSFADYCTSQLLMAVPPQSA